MKLLVISDSHGYDEELKYVLNHTSYDYVIHCGDSHFNNNDPILKEFAAIVRGNHDEDFLPLTSYFSSPLGLILICHGHTFHVYKGYDELVSLMKESDIRLCFHGHTHVPHVEKYKECLFINPGSIMFNRGKTECGSFAIVDINKEIKVEFFDSRTLKKIPQSIIDQDQDILNEFKMF